MTIFEPAKVVRFQEFLALYARFRQFSADFHFFSRKVKGRSFKADFVLVAIASWIETTHVVDIKRELLTKGELKNEFRCSNKYL